MTVYLLSSVVAPAFAAGRLTMKPVHDIRGALSRVDKNYHGHPATVDFLRTIRPDLPEATRSFWKGDGRALAIRPKAGVRNAAQRGDTQINSLDELEAVWITYERRAACDVCGNVAYVTPLSDGNPPDCPCGNIMRWYD